MSMDRKTALRHISDAIFRFGSANGKMDYARLRVSFDLALKIVQLGGPSNYVAMSKTGHEASEVAKTIRAWALLQNETKLDLSDDVLVGNLARCVLENLDRKDTRHAPADQRALKVRAKLWDR